MPHSTGEFINSIMRVTHHRSLPGRFLHQSSSLWKSCEQATLSIGCSGYPQLSSHCFGITGMIDFSQLSTSFFSQSSTTDADGRRLDSGPSSTTQVATSNSHNVSENPTGGLSGRSPFMTFQMTVTFLVVSLNGWHPVSTC